MFNIKAFKNLTDFLNKLQIPYYEDYTYEIVSLNDNRTKCFGQASSNLLSLGIIKYIYLTIIWLIII
jgi:hypothetical protein